MSVYEQYIPSIIKETGCTRINRRVLSFFFFYSYYYYFLLVLTHAHITPCAVKTTMVRSATHMTCNTGRTRLKLLRRPTVRGSWGRGWYLYRARTNLGAAGRRKGKSSSPVGRPTHSFARVCVCIHESWIETERRRRRGRL